MEWRSRLGAFDGAGLLAALLAALLVAGCGSVSVEEDVGPGDTPQDVAEDAAREDAPHDLGRDVAADDFAADTADVEPDGGDDGAADGIGEDDAADVADSTIDSGPACEVFEFPAANDTFLIPESCNRANYEGANIALNLGMGPGLFRFVLSELVTEAFAAGRVPEGSLRLQVMGTCPDGLECPFVAGRLHVRPLRDDWDEGSSPVFEAYSGADWCRREGGNPGPRWAADGASGGGDVDSVSGSLEIPSLPRSVSVPFEPAQHLPRFNMMTRAISMRVAFESGVGGLVVHSRESSGLAPTLILTVCE